MSTAPVSRAAKNLGIAKTFTHKYLDNGSKIYREINAKNHIRKYLPSDVFVMIKPGVPLPRDVVLFKVPLNYNKIMIKNYIEELYQIPVKKVNTAIFLGKTRLDGLGFYKRRSDWKKAYVRIDGEFSYQGFKIHDETSLPKNQ